MATAAAIRPPRPASSRQRTAILRARRLRGTHWPGGRSRRAGSFLEALRSFAKTYPTVNDIRRSDDCRLGGFRRTAVLERGNAEPGIPFLQVPWGDGMKPGRRASDSRQSDLHAAESTRMSRPLENLSLLQPGWKNVLRDLNTPGACATSVRSPRGRRPGRTDDPVDVPGDQHLRPGRAPGPWVIAVGDRPCQCPRLAEPDRRDHLNGPGPHHAPRRGASRQQRHDD